MYRLEQYGNDPILVLYAGNTVDIDVINEYRTKIRDYMTTVEGPFCLVVDAREVKTDFAQALRLLQSNPEQFRQQLAERGRLIFVGNHTFLKMYHNAISQPQYGGLEAELYIEFDEAMEVARRFIADFGWEDSTGS